MPKRLFGSNTSRSSWISSHAKHCQTWRSYEIWWRKRWRKCPSCKLNIGSSPTYWISDNAYSIYKSSSSENASNVALRCWLLIIVVGSSLLSFFPIDMGLDDSAISTGRIFLMKSRRLFSWLFNDCLLILFVRGVHSSSSLYTIVICESFRKTA